jgi:hypothetical protein
MRDHYRRKYGVSWGGSRDALTAIWALLEGECRSMTTVDRYARVVEAMRDWAEVNKPFPSA